MLTRLLADQFEVARDYARRRNLVCDDGTVVCWHCRKRESLLPSLHCPVCLADAWRRLGIIEPKCEQREQTEDDKRRMAQMGAAE